MKIEKQKKFSKKQCNEAGLRSALNSKTKQGKWIKRSLKDLYSDEIGKRASMSKVRGQRIIKIAEKIGRSFQIYDWYRAPTDIKCKEK